MVEVICRTAGLPSATVHADRRAFKTFPLLAAALALCGCQTVAPGTPRILANCDVAIRAHAKIRPDAVNSSEWIELSWARTRSMSDKNGDGRIDRAEWLGYATPGVGAAYPEMWAKARSQLEKTFDKIDRQHKGYLEISDYVAGYDHEFRKRDRNRDGWIDRDECALSFPAPF